ncbi:MAG: cobalamin biosynthesis protein CobQ [Ruminococcus sp.]|nr:cobalamin biosynthesis protein CobQ [Ruminococcus sp.]MCM1380557.1 hypothetical protein [Muribaculaceae bacterium]MCM1478936.1 hypothetical protein [Muribaculaceae bacterium]
MKKINIITGHYGSGKTNFSANLAVRLAERGERVTVVDLDIVNPYFRSSDFGELFGGKNIQLVAPMYANSNLDIPAISFDLERLANENGYLIIDVGGDDAGAIALGRYKNAFAAFEDDVAMLYVVNCRRFLTSTAEEALELMYEIETAAGMRHTAIVNNTNLLYETTAEVLEQSESFAAETAERAGLPIECTCVPMGISARVTNPFPVEIYVKKIWETD